MKYRRRMLVLMLGIAMVACNRGHGPNSATITVEAAKAARTSVDKTTHGRNRINSFFYAAVVPKLQPCWSKVQGQGAIVFKYTYRRVGMNWVAEGQDLGKSNLPPEQQKLALQCMQDATRDTSFPMEAIETTYSVNEMTLYWDWPVPFPQDVTELGRMVQNGNGELPGYGCQDCDLGSDNKFHCKGDDKFGWSACEASDYSCTVKFPLCGTGWPSPLPPVFIASSKWDPATKEIR
jgi:hypothetical protein